MHDPAKMGGMMDVAIDNALKTRAELRRRLAEVEQFLSLYEKFKGVDLSLGTSLADTGSKAELDQQADTGKHESRDVESLSMPSSKLSREALKPHLMAAILEAGRPLTRGELLRALDRDGIVVGGVDRSKNMGTIMWRLKSFFTNLEGLGYWPKDQPYPPAGYNPTRE